MEVACLIQVHGTWLLPEDTQATLFVILPIVLLESAENVLNSGLVSFSSSTFEVIHKYPAGHFWHKVILPSLDLQAFL